MLCQHTFWPKYSLASQSVNVVPSPSSSLLPIMAGHHREQSAQQIGHRGNTARRAIMALAMAILAQQEWGTGTTRMAIGTGKPEEACQKKDWKGHKEMCKALTQLREARYRTSRKLNRYRNIIRQRYRTGKGFQIVSEGNYQRICQIFAVYNDSLVSGTSFHLPNGCFNG